MWRWPSSRTVVTGTALAAFAVCSLLPVGYLAIAAAAAGDGAWSSSVLDARQRALLYNTAALGLGTALLSTAIGTPLGLAMARIRLPGKPLLRIALAAPLLLPPYVAGVAWTHLASPRGPLAAVAGRDRLADWTYSLPAAVVVLSLILYPLSMLATEVALRRIDGRLEEAGLVHAAPGRVLRRITLPLAAPSLLAAGLVIFVLAVSDFGVPGLLRVRVYTTEVFTAFAAFYDFSRAMILAVPLLLLCLTMAIAAAFLLVDSIGAPRRAAGTPAIQLDRLGHPALAHAALVAAAALVVPLAILVRESMRAQSAWSVVAGSRDAIVTSLVTAAAGATAVVAVAVWLGYARARAGRRLGLLADVVFVSAFAVPSTIVGVGLIALWNRPGPAGVVYGTVGMFLLAHLARFVPVAALVLAASVRYVSISQEEAAAAGGAAWLRTMWRIVLPQIRPGLAAAWAIAFVLAFGELGVSILVAPPGGATLPIRIYTIIANTPPSHVAALALLQTAVILAPVTALGILASLRPVGVARSIRGPHGGGEPR